MKTFRKFPSINQFSGVVKQVRDHCKYNNIPLPVLNFTGSVKIHGTNSAIGFSKDDIWFQSRERIISSESDNAGFATWGESVKNELLEFYKVVCKNEELDHDYFYIYGEWFGKGIQKSVAVSQLETKKFGIFKMVFVKDDQEFELDVLDYASCIGHYVNAVVVDSIVDPYDIEIDFNEPHLVQNQLLEYTLAVEKECPVGKYFGITGIGEGLVWSTKDVEWVGKFKTKGELHVGGYSYVLEGLNLSKDDDIIVKKILKENNIQKFNYFFL